MVVIKNSRFMNKCYFKTWRWLFIIPFKKRKAVNVLNWKFNKRWLKVETERTFRNHVNICEALFQFIEDERLSEVTMNRSKAAKGMKNMHNSGSPSSFPHCSSQYTTNSSSWNPLKAFPCRSMTRITNRIVIIALMKHHDECKRGSIIVSNYNNHAYIAMAKYDR